MNTNDDRFEIFADIGIESVTEAGDLPAKLPRMHWVHPRLSYSKETWIGLFWSGTGEPVRESGHRAVVRSVPEMLTDPIWRTPSGLISQWRNADHKKILNQRIAEGKIHLNSRLDPSSGKTNNDGRFYFKLMGWHVCGDDDDYPAIDRVHYQFDRRGQIISGSTLVACGLRGLVHIPSGKELGVVVKKGTRGRYCGATVSEKIAGVGKGWRDYSPKPKGVLDYFVITEGSMRWGGLIPGHLTHRFGGTVDIRPISTDGKPTSVGKENYSKEGTSKLVELLKHSGATLILFSDDIPGVEPKSGHKNHLHVSWLSDPREPWLFPIGR